MSASLVGSEMCIRDRRLPPRQVAPETSKVMPIAAKASFQRSDFRSSFEVAAEQDVLPREGANRL
eukprot:15080903-Alexandrium_andersonii.AAC.1